MRGEDMGEYSELAEKAREKDPKAFASLYEMVYQDMYHMALYTLRNPQDAEDVVSETVMDAYTGIQKLRDADAFRGWIFKILSNKCKRRLKEYMNKPVELGEELMGTAAFAAHTRDPDENLQVREAFFRLGEEERLIVAMKVFGGYQSKEIGAILHKSHNTVRSKLSRALEKMQRYLEE